MEAVGLKMREITQPFWNSKRVFVTGHTGFKGSWISLWLSSMGAKVYGLSLEPPTKTNLFDEAGVAHTLTSTIGDIRDSGVVLRAMKLAEPDIVLHLAAQPLVRYSYDNPVETYATNVMGTIHVLEAARQIDTVKAIVNITTDKCYDNKEWIWGYRETEAMGGYDPYSNSKGCSELVTTAYRNSFFQQGETLLASARAGNVIGGGDWADDRLLPDIFRSLEKKECVQLRYPNAIRPWQHVLEPLSGYLTLAERLFMGERNIADGWNFGPRDEDAKPVKWIADTITRAWGDGASWEKHQAEHAHEAQYLKLDISKAKELLNWEPKWNLDEALTNTVSWHKAWLNGSDMQKFCIKQIQNYLD